MLDKPNYIDRFVQQLEVELALVEAQLDIERVQRPGGISGPETPFMIEAARRCANLEASIDLLRRLLLSQRGLARYGVKAVRTSQPPSKPATPPTL